MGKLKEYIGWLFFGAGGVKSLKGKIDCEVEFEREKMVKTPLS